MATMQKNRTNPARQAGVKDSVFIPERYQHPAAIVVLFFSLVIFFHEIVFSGKVFLSADTIASHSFDTISADAKAQGIFPLWNPYIFCGMPSYASLTFGGERLFDILGYLLNKIALLYSYLMMNPSVGWVLFYYFVFAVGMYFFTFQKLQNKIAALVASLGATYSTFIIIWVMVGHNTKIAVISWVPLVFYVVEKQREHFDFRFGLFLILLLHFMFIPAHVQMIFYMYLALGVYFLFYLLRSLMKKEDWKGVLRSALVLGAASIIAFSMDADKYLSVLEYNPYSMRGASPIVQSKATAEAKTSSGGLDYAYATNWSFSPGEMMTFLLPSWYGFGNHTYQGSLTGNQAVRINTYWGPQPQPVDAPQYMGVVILMLAVFGFVRHRKNPSVQYLALMIVLSLLIAFGREFPIVYDLMFKYFPGFNKFRVPSMILVIVQMMVPILAAYGVFSFVNNRPKALSPDSERRWKYTLAGMGILLLLGLVAPSFFRSIYESVFSPQQIARRWASYPPNVSNELYSFVFNAVMKDYYVGLTLLLIAFGSLYLYLRQRLGLSTLGVIITLTVAIDLWRVDYKPMESHDKQQQQTVFAASDYVRFLQQDTTLFRVLEFEDGQTPYSNTLAYWRIQSVYGYQGAKIRAYQDMVDVIGLRNPLLWGLMNVKYIISNQPDSSAGLGLVYNGTDKKIYLNLSHLPRAFFVNRYEVASAIAILNKIANLEFDPRDVAYFLNDPKIQIEPPQPWATATFTRYGIQDFEMNVTASGNNLLFLSEVHYPEGWKAFLDGQPTEIYRVNYLFRGVVVPPGSHKLEMRFEPRGFYLGRTLSLAANILVLCSLGFFGVRYWRRSRTDRPGN